MKKIFVVLFATLLCMPAFAQRVELYAGAQFEHAQPSFNAPGWNASLTGNFKHFLGITADFSGGYRGNPSRSLHTYTFGPVLSARLPVVQPYVHALFGAATASASGASSDTAFCMFLGGGLDVGLRRGIAWRLVQADWMRTSFGNETQNNQGRVSTGLLIKF